MLAGRTTWACSVFGVPASMPVLRGSMSSVAAIIADRGGGPHSPDLFRAAARQNRGIMVREKWYEGILRPARESGRVFLLDGFQCAAPVTPYFNAWPA